jgi:hypothetical protein
MEISNTGMGISHGMEYAIVTSQSQIASNRHACAAEDVHMAGNGACSSTVFWPQVPNKATRSGLLPNFSNKIKLSFPD